ncbi:DeoR/GlpR family DNA-binding transcription regulator [Ornithinicoccus halotolerans]|uniref:DeoR/GlpR family DNA-binding transcription regulator n=1 Tax=Ornithinicoccus halotolerans TaxID=1748220 RepID=UPI0012959E46|nr:DeoR/GlpR family DNA-binding transcription regulator [Ornithinicoccus halotolerans]
MLAEARRGQILTLVRAHGSVQVADLIARFAVSEMTARRDIARLAADGLVDRVHGGAVLPREASVAEPGFAAKTTRAVPAKQAIARAAVALVQPGTAVGLSAGTTTHAAAGLLTDVPGLTVVTNSLPVAALLHERGRPDQRVLLTGGERTPSDALVGPIALAALEGLHLDTVLLGAHGLDLRAGLTTPTLEESRVDAALAGAARRVIAVVDHTKWQVVGLSTAVPLSGVDVLVTDDGLPAPARTLLAEHVGRLVVATTPTGARPAHSAARTPSATGQQPPGRP